jgi:hypothetical protein
VAADDADPRIPPLRPAERRWIGAFFPGTARFAERLALPEADLAFRRAQRDASSPDHSINDSAFSLGEGAVVAVGQVPQSPYAPSNEH